MCNGGGCACMSTCFISKYTQATTNPNLPYISDHLPKFKINWKPFSNFKDETFR